jgi:hypothetical protein
MKWYLVVAVGVRTKLVRTSWLISLHVVAPQLEVISWQVKISGPMSSGDVASNVDPLPEPGQHPLVALSRLDMLKQG